MEFVGGFDDDDGGGGFGGGLGGGFGEHRLRAGETTNRASFMQLAQDFAVSSPSK